MENCAFCILHSAFNYPTPRQFNKSARRKKQILISMTAAPTTVADPGTVFHKDLEQCLPLTCALKSLNRGMGLPDLYPFVLCAPAMKKPLFVNEVVQQSRAHIAAEQSILAER